MTLVWIYLALGAVTGGICYLAFSHGIRLRDQGHPQMTETLNEAERVVGRIPGGMIALLIVSALFWPVLLSRYVKKRIEYRRRR